MTIALTVAASPTWKWADDLRQVVGERRLIELALESAHTVGEGLPRPEGIPEDLPNPPILLTLLTYCYAAGIYGSEEIEWACENDESVRYICGRTFPEAHTLRRFRRANRPWIEECVLRVYASACFPSESSGDLNAYVRRKIELAIMTDTATADCY